MPRAKRTSARAAARPSPATTETALETPAPALVPLSELRPHPRNYRHHPERQLIHIAMSLHQNGFYRNVVAARDGTILAGHGVVLAAPLVAAMRSRMRVGGIESFVAYAELLEEDHEERRALFAVERDLSARVPVIRLDLDPEDARAKKILAADNELGRFAEDDDRALTELLREINENDGDALLGTGYDPEMLAALAMVTRPAHEIRDLNEAREWVGMPDYHESEGERFQLVVTFETAAARKRFVEEKEIAVIKTVGDATWSARWPAVVNEDVSTVRFTAKSRKRIAP